MPPTADACRRLPTLADADLPEYSIYAKIGSEDKKEVTSHIQAPPYRGDGPWQRRNSLSDILAEVVLLREEMSADNKRTQETQLLTKDFTQTTNAWGQALYLQTMMQSFAKCIESQNKLNVVLLNALSQREAPRCRPPTATDGHRPSPTTDVHRISPSRFAVRN